MKNGLLIIGLLSVVLFSSCKKNETHLSDGFYIKSIESDSDAVVIESFQLNDGSTMVIGCDFSRNAPGYAFKTDGLGNVIFKKRLSPLNLALQGAIELSGSGFVTYGFASYYIQKLTLCFYDENADFLSSKELTLPETIGNFSVFRAIQLKNGNYVFAAAGAVVNAALMIITDNNFNKIYTRTYSQPNGWYGLGINTLCEMPDGTIALSGSSTWDNWDGTYFSNALILRTGPTGIQKSLTFISDTAYSESPNCIININDNLFMVSARSNTKDGENGVFVDYEKSRVVWTISGMINLCNIDTSDKVIDRQMVSGYPRNGMIKSLRQTAGGGYILCGTVNQGNANNFVSDTRIFIVKLNATLNVEWTKTFSTVYPSYGVEAVQTSEGGYFICGYERTFNQKFNAIIIKTDAAGNVR